MPEDPILQALDNKELVLFIGADLPQATTGLPSRQELGRGLAQRHSLEQDLSLAETAQRVMQAGSRFEFTSYLLQALDTVGRHPQLYHRRIAALAKEHKLATVITIAYDDLLEQALRDAEVAFNRVVDQNDVLLAQHDRLTLIKLYGTLDRADSLVVTEQDHTALLRDQERKPVMDEVRQAFRRNTVLFIGYNLDDPDFRLLFDEVAESRFTRLHYAVWPGMPESDRQMWRDRGIIILEQAPPGILDDKPLPVASVPVSAGGTEAPVSPDQPASTPEYNSKKTSESKKPRYQWIFNILGDARFQGIVALFALMAAMGAWLWPDIRPFLLSTIATPTATITPMISFTPSPTTIFTQTPTLTSTLTPSPTLTSTPSPSFTPTLTPAPRTDEILVSLIEAEGKAAVNKDITAIRQIFAPDAQRYNAITGERTNAIAWYEQNFNPDNPDRYEFTRIDHLNYNFSIHGDTAVVTNDSCGVLVYRGNPSNFASIQSDRWTFRLNEQNRWWITEFAFNLSSQLPSLTFSFEDGPAACWPWAVRYFSGVPQGQPPAYTEENSYSGKGALRFDFDTRSNRDHRGQFVLYNVPFAGRASAYVYLPPDAPGDIEAGFFAQDSDHPPYGEHKVTQYTSLQPGKWTRVEWNISVQNWKADPLHLFGLEVRQAKGDYQGYILVDDIVIISH